MEGSVFLIGGTQGAKGNGISDGEVLSKQILVDQEWNALQGGVYFRVIKDTRRMHISMFIGSQL